MTTGTMRPTFEVEVPQAADELQSRIGSELKKPEWRGISKCYGNYCELHVPEAETRYWSPHLTMYLEGDQSKTHILCRYSPRIEVWTFVCVIYMALSFTAFFSMIYTFSLWLNGEFSWMGLVPPIAVGGIGLLYLVSRIGQQWSAHQMVWLHAEFDKLMSRVRKDDIQATVS